MLPPINILNTDLVELSSDMPAEIGYANNTTEFQVSLGEVMISSESADEPLWVIEPGEILPLDGNSLPADGATPAWRQVGPMQIDEISIAVTEQAVTEQADETDNPKPGVSSIQAQSGIAAEGTVLSNARSDNRRQADESIFSGQIRDRIQLPLQPRNVPVFDSQATSISSARLAAGQQNDTLVQVADSVRLSASDADNLARTMANVASTPVIGPSAERPDGLTKRINAAVSQPTIITADSAGLLHGPAQAARSAQAPPLAASIDIPVLDKAWEDALNERVLWMAGKSIQKAEIRLNPADLGPIRIEVSIVDDAARVSFSTQHAVTREAIESAMPRLREMLSESGISLANADVSDGGVQHEQHASENEALHGPTADASGPEEGDATMITSVRSGMASALVDTFV